MDINRKNQLLLNKLVDISHGRQGGVTTANEARRMTHLAHTKSLGRSTAASSGSFLTYGVYSGAGTNTLKRKTENDRI